MANRQPCPSRPAVSQLRPLVSVSTPPAGCAPVGRFRSGRMAGGLPEALKSWRIVTPFATVANSAAQLLGGAVHHLPSNGGDAFEVLTNAAEIDIVVDAPRAITTELKLWDHTGLIHHCDGSAFLSTDGQAGSACGCPTSQIERRALARAGQGPQVYTSTTFRLASQPSIGTFLHESLSWELADEITGVRAAVDRTGRPAHLKLKLGDTEFASSAGIRVTRPRPLLEFVAPMAAGWTRFRDSSAHLTTEAARATWGAVVRALRRLRGVAGSRATPVARR
jgi:hypothetical protein